MQVRSVWPALLLATGLASPVAWGSACLRETAPEVEPFLQSGAEPEVRAAIAAIDDRLVDLEPGDAAPWLTAQASMLLDLEAWEEAESLLADAISGWLHNDRIDAEICSRHLLIYSLSSRFENQAALAETLLAKERAQSAGLTDALHRLQQTHITLLLTLNTRIEEALVMLEESSPGSSLPEQINWHHNRGLLLSRLQRHVQAAGEFERVLDLIEPGTMPVMLAATRFNLANQLIQATAGARPATTRERILELLESVTDDEHARPSTRALAWRSRGLLLEPSEREDPLRRCVAEAEKASDNRRKALCLAELAELILADDPDGAAAALAEARALAGNDARARMQIQSPVISILWATLPPAQAFTESLAVLSGERQQRDQQMHGLERERVIDGLTREYRSLADRAYHHADQNPELMEQAFTLLESNRALVLREDRRRAQHVEQDDEMRQLATRINQSQHSLLNAKDDADVESAKRELAALEARWRRITLAEPEAVNPVGNGISLAELQGALGEDEALLSFLTYIPNSLDDPPGWLQLITPAGSQLFPLPAQAWLLNASDMLIGADDWSSEHSQQVIRVLSERMLQPALSTLPEAIGHLIIVPDSGIAGLPLELLLEAGGEPAGIRYSIDYTPSASVWLHTRQQPRSTGQVLVLADPDLPASGYRALDEAFSDRPFEPLQGARREARFIRGALGRAQTDTRVGPDANEAVLRSETGRYHGSMIHFATHSLIHPTRPERSAVILAAGGEHFDGLLQGREIEQLALPGAAIVLASCASATGEWLDTEGVVSLARSFMIAGASSVVATRWPVDDQLTAAFFDRAYRHLGQGHSLSSALQQARRDLHDNGYPEHAWSAFVLYGDGNWQPVEKSPRWPGYALIILGIILTLTCLNRLRHQRAPR